MAVIRIGERQSSESTQAIMSRDLTNDLGEQISLSHPSRDVLREIVHPICPCGYSIIESHHADSSDCGRMKASGGQLREFTDELNGTLSRDSLSAAT
jgi:hypothetical protein